MSSDQSCFSNPCVPGLLKNTLPPSPTIRNQKTLICLIHSPQDRRNRTRMFEKVAFSLQEEGNEHKSRNIRASPSAVAKLSYLWHSSHITFIPHPSAFLPPILPFFYPTTFTMAPEYLITPSFKFCIYLSKGQDIFVDVKTTIRLLIIT